MNFNNNLMGNINPMHINNNIMMQYMNKNLVNNTINPIMINEFFKLLKINPMKALFMMKQMNPTILNQYLKKFLEKTESEDNKKLNNNEDTIIQEYEIIDTETNPMNKFIENAINITYTMKLEIIKQKLINPNIILNISQVLSVPGLLVDQKPSNEDYKYILCLIGRILENNGIEVGIYKENNIKDRIDLTAIQFIFSGLINKKKYKLYFNLNEDEIICILHSLEYKKIFIEKWKNFISQKLAINKNLIILTNPRRNDEQKGNFNLDLSFNPEIKIINEKLLIKKIIHGEIIDCQIFPLLEGCRLSSNIFDSNFNTFYNNNNQIYQKRGGEEYINPFGWTAYGINILGKYDFGDNTWLGSNNKKGEFAVAYYGINNVSHQNIQIIQNIISLMGNYESGQTFVNEINIRKPGQKCMSGAYFYKSPEIAENSSEIINIGGFDYKIMFMCRINPSKIRQPQNFQDLWILSPISSEIRPYKILIKKIPKSPLANGSQQNIKISTAFPPNLFYQILQQKDESYFNSNTSGINNFDYALKSYTGGSYSSINQYLRNNLTDNYNQNLNNLKSMIWCLHKSITYNNINVPDGTILYRGVCKKWPNNIGVGTKFFFPEFISTSKDINVAKSFGGSGTLMYITVKNNGINGKNGYCRDVEYI